MDMCVWRGVCVLMCVWGVKGGEGGAAYVLRGMFAKSQNMNCDYLSGEI